MISDAALWAVRDAPVADLEEWAVLVCLAERADDDGEGCWPSHQTIGKRLLLSVSTVKRRIETLETRGLIRRGNQSRAAHIREDRRPVVWDLMIPYSWFPNIARIQEWREDHGRPLLTPKDRPDLPPAPPKRRRADLGRPRRKPTGLEDPSHGGACSSPTGGLVDPDGRSSRATNPYPSKGDPKERTSAETSAPPELVVIDGGAMTIEAAAAEARTIVTAYMDWWKIERNVKVIPDSSRAFHMLVGAGRTRHSCHFVTEALLSGIPADAIKRILAEHGRHGQGVVPSKPRWVEAIVRAQGGSSTIAAAGRQQGSPTDDRVQGWLDLGQARSPQRPGMPELEGGVG